MPKIITVTTMMRSFSDIIGRVYYQGESFDIKKGANVVARIMPPKAKNNIKGQELFAILKDAPHLDIEDIKDFEESTNQLRKQKDEGGFDKWD